MKKQILNNGTKSLKTRVSIFITIWMVALSYNLNAQSRIKMGVLNIATSVQVPVRPEDAGNIARYIVDETGKYEVLDKYDIDATLKKANFDIQNCYGKTCVLQAGKLLGADKMLSGNVDKMNGRFIVSLRLLDVASGEVEKEQIDEYLFLPDNIKDMFKVSIYKILGLPVDEELATKLAKKDDYASEINTPETGKLVLNGPRMGFAMFNGQLGERITAPASQGGIAQYQGMFVVGYQQEMEYLNSGNFQALFEVIPAITGLDQGLCIPSLSFLNGFRDNKNGWEFAFGPVFTLARMSNGYDSSSHNWVQLPDGAQAPTGFTSEMLPDSRGNIRLRSQFIFAAGRSFKSGRMNIPINFYFIPSYKEGSEMGVSIGFNLKKS